MLFCVLQYTWEFCFLQHSIWDEFCEGCYLIHTVILWALDNLHKILANVEATDLSLIVPLSVYFVCFFLFFFCLFCLFFVFVFCFCSMSFLFFFQISTWSETRYLSGKMEVIQSTIIIWAHCEVQWWRVPPFAKYTNPKILLVFRYHPNWVPHFWPWPVGAMLFTIQA